MERSARPAWELGERARLQRVIARVDRRMRDLQLLLLVSALALGACKQSYAEDERQARDAGTPRDATTMPRDAAPPKDAGLPPKDGGLPKDATPIVDAGAPMRDGNVGPGRN